MFKAQSWLLAGALGGALAFTGCSNSTESEGGEEPQPDAPAEEEVPEGELADVPTKIDIAAVRNTARTAIYVPAPTEFQAALKVSAPELDLKKLVKDTDRKLEGKQEPIIALETGVRITNVLMSAHGGETEPVIDRMKRAREGLVALKAPAEITGELDKVVAEIEKGTIGSAELAPALDVLAEQIQDKLLTRINPNAATLVQAGGWLQAANLMSKAVGDAGLSGDAAKLLHQPSLLEHFLTFLKESDPARAGDPQVTSVITEMEKMRVIAAKDELTNEDVKAVNGHTEAILAAF